MAAAALGKTGGVGTAPAIMPHRLADYGYGVRRDRSYGTGSRINSARRPAPSFPVIWAESVTSDGRFVWRSEKRNHAPWFAARRPKDDWLIVTQPCVLLQRTTAKEQPRRLIAAELPASFIRKHKGRDGRKPSQHGAGNRAETARAGGGDRGAAQQRGGRCGVSLHQRLGGGLGFRARGIAAAVAGGDGEDCEAGRRRRAGGEIEAAIAAAYGRKDAAAAA